MKRICDLTPEQTLNYMQDLARATRCVVSPGAEFILIVVDERGLANFVASIPDDPSAKILREVAAHLNKQQAAKN